jgi:16S rRNA (guanine527-N7)-methyltransferase
VKHPAPYDAEAFAADTGVSRETLERLTAYADLLRHWNAKINLIGRSTVAELWWRHMLDSAQLMPLLPSADITLVDMGSGAGFPGLVLAAMGIRQTHLIEGGQRKAAFLREAAAVLDAPVTVHACQTEDAPAIVADVITARALAPLPALLDLAARFTGPSTIHIYPKGQNVEGELTQTHKIWTMRLERFPSRTEPAASILRLSEVRRVRSRSPERPA